jgi:formylmethanofuran dehydrogenase subunit E
LSCAIPQDEIHAIINFHGHYCPGLAIGIRAGELARREFGQVPDYEMVCVSETDMCGVDAVQFLLGCTMGKGNLIHRDYGKMAFSFFHRPSGQGFRCLVNPDARGDMAGELSELHKKIAWGKATRQDRDRAEELKRQMADQVMAAELDDLFIVTEPFEPMPRGARILQSLTCEQCGEAAMESRTRRFGGKTLCLPCFNKVEQKI